MMTGISTSQGKRTSSFFLYLAAAFAPILFFYAVLFLTARNLPLGDDYDAGLNFANQLVQLHSFSDRLILLISSQHNEYKLFFGHGLVWLELGLIGHLNFAVLSAIGNLFVLFLAVTLWKMFLPGSPVEKRLLLFLPVCFLLFQYQYIETLNWPLPGVQNITVVAFAVASIYYLDRRTTRSFMLAVLFLIAAICSSGNGFILAAVGVVMLAMDRAYTRLAIWLATMGLLGWAYAFHYAHYDPAHNGHSSFSNILHPNLIYLLSFLGSAAQYHIPFLSVVFGLVLCIFWGWAIRRGYLKRNQAVGYCLLFIFLTSIGVAGIRSELGLAGSTSYRYRMYSDLLLIFVWFALVNTYRLNTTASLRRSRIFVTAICFSVLFCMSANLVGMLYLRKRDKSLDIGMSHFEHSSGALSPVYSIDGTVQDDPSFVEQARQTLLESERRGTYQPPQY